MKLSNAPLYASQPINLIVLGLICCCVVANAQTLNRCVDANGGITYSDTECSGQRSVVKVSPNTVGDGGSAIAKKQLERDTARNALDLAIMRYQLAVDFTARLRAILDNNDATKTEEMNTIIDEKEKCRRAGNFSRRCHTLQALTQREIDDKYHDIWIKTHREWSVALLEQTNAAREVIRLGGALPKT